MRVLITGGAGFIGSNLVRFLNQNEPAWELVVLDDLSTGLKTNLKTCSSQIIEGSILDWDLLEHAAHGVDHIVHLAAIGSVPRSISFPRPTHEANATGTLNVLEAARLRSVKSVIVASSSSVYGSNPKIPRSEKDWTRPISPYAVSKLATEAYANAYSEAYGLSTIAFRLFNVYGPKQRADHPYAAVIPRFVSAALSDEPLQIHGDGLQTRDFTFVDSVCEAILTVIRNSLSFKQPVNLAFGTKVSILQLVSLVGMITGKTLTLEHTDRRSADVSASQADTSLLEELLPSISKFNLEEGLRATVDWYRAVN